MQNQYKSITLELETIIDYLRFGISEANRADLYYGHGTENAVDDMFALVLDTLSLPHDLDAHFYQAKLTLEERKQLTQHLEKRIISRVPVPYLTNKAYFCNMPFFIDQRVLIPRSPIAELIKNHFSPWINEEEVHTILDLCTGSACIAIACCDAFPNVEVDASDISKEALAVAKINQKRYELEEQLHLIESDGFDSIPAKRYDIIVSNPPYVSPEEMQTLPAEYLHEPRLALEARESGLHIVMKILKSAKNYLSDNGILVVEVGNSDIALQEAFPEVPFVWLEFEHGGHGVFLLTAEQLREFF